MQTSRPKLKTPGLFWRGGTIHLKIHLRGGRVIRKSCKTDRIQDARHVLDVLRGQYATGTAAPPRADRVTVDHLLDDLETEYRTNERRSLERLGNSLAHLRPVFGTWRAQAVTGAEVLAYVDRRQSEQAANATINRELAALKRAYTLAADGRRITQRPVIKMLEERNVRQGFFEKHDFKHVLEILPAHLVAPVTFMYLTGWRSKSEVLPLTWAQVDLDANIVRLEPGTTKNDEGRTVALTAELRQVLVTQRARVEAIQRQASRILPNVFTHDDGRPIKDFRKSWNTACRRAGVPGKIPHDLRRTAVRNLERDGIPRAVAMKITGHKTESVYRRYAVVSERDLHDAAARIDRAAGHKTGAHGLERVGEAEAGVS